MHRKGERLQKMSSGSQTISIDCSRGHSVSLTEALPVMNQLSVCFFH